MKKKYPKIKSWVTYLEMNNNPQIENIDLKDLSIQLKGELQANDYLALYKEVGKHYIWNYRPSQSIKEVQEIISSPSTKVFFFLKNETVIGFSEVDCADPKNIEIVHFGLLNEYINKGFGEKLFLALLKELWVLNPDRLFLSTCGLDHPKAVKFYQSAGFEIFKQKENVEFEDYRYSDFYDMSDAPQIPLAGEKQ